MTSWRVTVVNPMAWRWGLAYGVLGLPLAFVSLPLYVSLPHHYAQTYGMSLTLLGTLLLATRLLDALIDPFIGRWLDRLFDLGLERLWHSMAGAGLGLFAGMTALWWPPAVVARSPTGLMLWLAAALMLTYLSFSWVSIAHQAWGARWGGQAVQRARWVAWREGAGLVGVILASTAPAWIGWAGSHGLMTFTLVVGLIGLWLTRSMRPGEGLQHPAHTDDSPAGGEPSKSNRLASIWLPWKTPGFAKLYVIFSLNGIASAVPATLMLFFVQDVLQATAWQPWFLATYFVTAAAGVPLWVRAVRRWGLQRAWLMGMALALLTFCATPLLGAGDQWLFLLVCIASGCALGADLVVPAAMLTGISARAQSAGRVESRFFAWWALAGKLNLALAAGISLPLLAFLGYTTGTTEPGALQALSLAYGLAPCLLKAVAFVVLLRMRPTPSTS